MKIFKASMIAAVAMLTLIGLQSSASAQPMTGSVSANGWTFNWDVTSTSGLRVTQVRKNGKMILYNGSLPAIRVEYNGNNCPGSPYVDRIKWDNIVPDGWGNKVRVVQDSGWLRVYVEAQIASYNLVQSWWFHNDLHFIVPDVSSSGLQCSVDHRHHPYWRMDFDVVSSGNNKITTVNGGTPTDQTVEFNTTVPVSGSLVNFYNNSDLSAYVSASPPVPGTADSFASWDYAGRRYPSSQNDPWAPSSPGFADQGDLEHPWHPSTSWNNENIAGQDIVFWYVGHLAHAASAGPSQVGIAGTWIWLTGY